MYFSCYVTGILLTTKCPLSMDLFVFRRTSTDGWLAASWFHTYKFSGRLVAKFSVLIFTICSCFPKFFARSWTSCSYECDKDDVHLFRYTYKLGHRLFNGSYVWSKIYSFRASPYPGQDSLQRVIIFGDMGKV